MQQLAFTHVPFRSQDQLLPSTLHSCTVDM
uniref:Uncharacterized protein n=1 Tax=Anguilla anguilla TaxID=7936 RepID=A0A0E9PR48_ANGAN